MDIVDYGELLARGIRAVRAGKNEEGKKYLAFAVRARPREPQACCGSLPPVTILSYKSIV